MKLYSSRNPKAYVSFKEAIFHGLAPDGGLFMPDVLPHFEASFLEQLRGTTFAENAFKIARVMLKDEIESNVLNALCKDAFNFDIPLIKLKNQTYILELFHGPTCAFKDIGARFMARLYGHYLTQQKENISILVATSGDTGSAVAHGFYDVEGVEVIILYPKGKISPIQEKQMTTLGKNIHALEVDGVFDDCQAFVKKAFEDEKLQSMRLSTANSINIARLIPQSFYYFHALSQLDLNMEETIFSIPSGNFGNLTAGLFAQSMGLPVKKFIAATNSNDTFPTYLNTGIFSPQPSKHTYSNAMDVGNPSNFERITNLYSANQNEMKDVIWSRPYSNKQTLHAIKKCKETYNYYIDPHSAVGMCGLEEYTREFPDNTGIILGTAHPAKFLDVVHKAIENPKVNIPKAIDENIMGEKKSIPVPAKYEAIREVILRTTIFR